ncbi:ROK family protein [Falsibacillus albus]|uniref:ROK family protein n=1 Tax=Falsibacillus albus TaxID=2478915 RepID=A0A3L7JT44_9BACI|nr:ROK family protein [Falsibacillus albus]RLQ94018.1 ROK family protein [Falsibacillus albus]
MGDMVIGVDIGGTNIRVGLINKDLQLLRKETALTSKFTQANDFFQHIKTMIERIDFQREASKIGMVLPVPWEESMQKISDASNLPFLENTQVNEIRSFFPEYELYFENDVNVIALLESNFGSSKNSENSLYITVSTGIGSGMILNNSIYRGTNGYAGEIGSMIISDENKHHLLLYKGTLESLCSGRSLEAESIKLYGENSTAKLLFEHYQNGDKNAIVVIEAWVDYFSSAIATLMQIVDPEVFVLGGSVIFHNQWLIERIIISTKQKVLKQLKDKVNIKLAKYGLDAGMIGAGHMAIKNQSFYRSEII